MLHQHNMTGHQKQHFHREKDYEYLSFKAFEVTCLNEYTMQVSLNNRQLHVKLNLQISIHIKGCKTNETTLSLSV